MTLRKNNQRRREYLLGVVSKSQRNSNGKGLWSAMSSAVENSVDKLKSIHNNIQRTPTNLSPSSSHIC